MPLSKACPMCGKVFSVKPCHNWRVFCSLACKGKHQSQAKRGEDNPSYKPELTRICLGCGKEFRNYRATVRYCSRACKRVAHLPEKRLGKRLGSARRRARKKGNGGAFTAAEWRALCHKFNYRCLACGRREPVIKLTVDHVLPIQMGGTNTIDNLQPLCGDCNSSKGARHIDYRPDSPNQVKFAQRSLW